MTELPKIDSLMFNNIILVSISRLLISYIVNFILDKKGSYFSLTPNDKEFIH